VTALNTGFEIFYHAKRFFAETEQTVFEALIDNGVIIRSDCGGKGRCGKCRVKIVNPQPDRITPPAEAELKALTEGELTAGFRLACCVKPLGDIHLEIPNETHLSADVLKKAPPLLLKNHRTAAATGWRSIWARRR
jgi:ferredoxin